MTPFSHRLLVLWTIVGLLGADLVQAAQGPLCKGNALPRAFAAQTVFQQEALQESSYGSDQPHWPIHGIKHFLVHHLQMSRRSFGWISLLTTFSARLSAQQPSPTAPPQGPATIPMLVRQQLERMLRAPRSITPAWLAVIRQPDYWNQILNQGPEVSQQAASLVNDVLNGLRDRSTAIGLDISQQLPYESFLLLRNEIHARILIAQMRQESDPQLRVRLLIEQLLGMLFEEQHFMTRALVERRLTAPPTDYLIWPRLEEALTLLSPGTRSLAGPLTQFKTDSIRTYSRMTGPEALAQNEKLNQLNKALLPKGYAFMFDFYQTPAAPTFIRPELFRLTPATRRLVHVSSQMVNLTDAETVWTVDIPGQSQNRRTGALVVSGMPNELLLISSYFTSLAKLLTSVRKAPTAEAASTLLNIWHPVIKRVVDLSFPPDETIITTRLRQDTLFHELLHFWQRLRKYSNPALITHLTQFVPVEAATVLADEYGAHLGMIVNSDNPYWYVLYWGISLTEAGFPRPNEAQAYVFDRLLRDLATGLRPKMAFQVLDRLDAILKTPGQLTTADGFRLMEIFLDGKIDQDTLRAFARSHYEQTFGPLPPTSILKARQNSDGTRLAWLRHGTGSFWSRAAIAATVIFTLFNGTSHVVQSIHLLHGQPLQTIASAA